jgi:thiol:disulfide interchange protein
MRASFGLVASALVVGVVSSARGATMSADETPDIPQIAWLHGAAVAIDEIDRGAVPPNTPALVFVTASWCGPCRLMKATTLRSNAVIDAARGFFAVEVDADVDRSFIASRRVERLPTIIIADPRGAEIIRVSGYVPEGRLAQALRKTSALTASSAPLEQIQRAVSDLLCTCREE